MKKIEGTAAQYFMVRYCTVDGMVLETCILSNIFGVGVFLVQSRAENGDVSVRDD